MRQIIGGKTYDTDAAEEIGHYWNGLGTGDFRNISESLYRTKKGNFFLAGSGGPMTKYSRPVGNMTGGGDGIIPMAKEEALAWAEHHEVSSEKIEKYFSDLVEEA